MLKYTSFMVESCCNATGKTEHETLKDLDINTFVKVEGLDLNVHEIDAVKLFF